MMLNIPQMKSLKIVPENWKFGTNIYRYPNFQPREFLTTEEFPKVPLIVQVCYNNTAVDGKHMKT